MLNQLCGNSKYNFASYLEDFLLDNKVILNDNSEVNCMINILDRLFYLVEDLSHGNLHAENYSSLSNCVISIGKILTLNRSSY